MHEFVNFRKDYIIYSRKIGELNYLYYSKNKLKSIVDFMKKHPDAIITTTGGDYYVETMLKELKKRGFDYARARDLYDEYEIGEFYRKEKVYIPRKNKDKNE